MAQKASTMKSGNELWQSTSYNPDETGRLWGKWKDELITRFRYFRKDGVQDRIDAISIYGGELVRELVNTVQDVPAPEEVQHNDFDKIIAKLDNYFIH